MEGCFMKHPSIYCRIPPFIAAFLLLLTCLVVVGYISLEFQQYPVKRCMRSLEQFCQELICILDRDTLVVLDQVAVSKVDKISFAECHTLSVPTDTQIPLY